MSLLMSPLNIKEVSFKNRIVVSPMCQYSSSDGFATSWHMVHLGSRAVGGAGLIIQEATAVHPDGRITYGDLGIWKDEHIKMLSDIVSFIHEQGSVAGIQLAHAGRKASCELPWKGGEQITTGENSWETLAPSPIAFKEGQVPPKALSVEEIRSIVIDFKRAAERAVKAGFKVIEIHAAHGYLINQFLSPLSNKRDDEYGGSFENRIRFLLEIIKSIQEVWPSGNPLFLRISSTDWLENGWNLEDSVELANLVASKGIDLIDASTGGVVPGVKIELVPGYQVQFAEAIRKQSPVKTGAVGLITNAEQAEQILQNGSADLIFFAREMLRDPYFAMHAEQELEDQGALYPVQYERARPKAKKN